ncbi:hypothetical protein O181_086205 [Austropuccinia psidii MF-1]|uniref:Uncharacterized protein n=1 Tax=Austropuccinia psidii MF-1 TaxID=1389203 RepID=A0A9Q3IN72_9BASI|nr:hypothetical protein [Austropuccinia psidii MF-1]
MTHTLTYHSIQNVQLRHHHVGRVIGPYAPATNGRCHLTLGPHISCLCVHDVSHPFTRTHCIVRWAPNISPAYAELIYGYTSFGLCVLITRTHLHPQYCVGGSTSVIRKMTIPRRQSPFMDDLVKSNPRLYIKTGRRTSLMCVCKQEGLV